MRSQPDIIIHRELRDDPSVSAVMYRSEFGDFGVGYVSLGEFYDVELVGHEESAEHDLRALATYGTEHASYRRTFNLEAVDGTWAESEAAV